MKRREAKALGLSQYNTGKPCPKGHISDRYTGNGNCVQCQRVVNANYVTDKLKEYKKKYYETHKEEISIKNKEKYKSKK
jgi:hypothetical protein